MTTKTTSPRRVVVGVDTSENAARAAGWAAQEAVDRDLALVVAHALEVPDGLLFASSAYADEMNDRGEKLLEQLTRPLRERHPDLSIETELKRAEPARMMVDYSAAAELLVTGTRGHGGFVGLLIGSVSLRTAAHAACPLVVVRGEEPGRPRPEIVLGIAPNQDQSPIMFAFASAAQVGASVRAVSAWQPMTTYGGFYAEDWDVYEKQATDETHRVLEQARIDFPDVPCEISVVRGNPVPMLAEASRGSRLLVVGARRHQGPLSVGLGYTVRGLLAHASAPLAVVPVV